jgi:hypothetical protein
MGNGLNPCRSFSLLGIFMAFESQMIYESKESREETLST